MGKGMLHTHRQVTLTAAEGETATKDDEEGDGGE